MLKTPESNAQYIANELIAVKWPYAVMGVGIQASGKSTVLTELAHMTGTQRICPDDIRKVQTGTATYNQELSGQAWAEAYRLADNALASGESIIIDAIHTYSPGRERDANRYHNAGALAVVAAVFHIPLEIALTRNARRDRVVDPERIIKSYLGLQKYPVTHEDGFDQIISIEQ